MAAEKTFPYSDKDMTYDYNSHKYVLTPQCVKNELGQDLEEVLDKTGDANPSTLAERFLKRVSHLVYCHIYAYAQNVPLVEYMLAKQERFRDVLKNAMLERVLFMLTSGDVTTQSGLNLRDGRKISKADLKDASIPMEEECILENAGLLYAGFRGFPFGFQFREGY